MTEKKNFTIENYNGTDYDTLYPETNSGQVLLDSNAQGTLGLASGSTLDAAFSIISEGNVIYKVGDALTTARTNLGNKWVLCNGAQVTPAQYPELSSLFTPQTYLFKKVTGLDLAASANASLAYNSLTNQLAYSYGMSPSSGSTYYLYYLNLDSISDGWTQVGSTFYDVGRIKCVNGIWVFGKTYYSGSLTSSTTFSSIGGSLSSAVIDAIYYNNYYYLFTGANTAVYSNLSLSPLATITNNGGSSGAGSLGVSPNGVISTALYVQTTTNITTYYTLIADDLTSTNGSWKSTDRLNSAGVSWGTYYNGYYYWYIQGYAGQYYLYRSSSLTATPTLFTTLNNSSRYYTLANNNLILSSYQYIDTSNTLKSFSASPSGSNSTAVVVTPINMYQMAGSESLLSLYSASTSSVIQLPSVSLGTGLYTYIRAKA